MGIPILEMEGYEADDILGTVSAKCEREGREIVLVTGDRDSFQLSGRENHNPLYQARHQRTPFASRPNIFVKPTA